MATHDAKASPPEPLKTKADFASRVSVSVVRAKTTRVEGGDWDDKRDRIVFTIKLRNTDPNRSFSGLKKFYNRKLHVTKVE